MSALKRTWYCVNCDRWFHHRGIATHRAAHARRLELVRERAHGYEYTYDYREPEVTR